MKFPTEIREEAAQTNRSSSSNFNRFALMARHSAGTRRQRVVAVARTDTFKASKAVRFVSGIFSRTLEREGIHLNIELDQDVQMYARYGAFNQVLNNLVDNAIYWLRQEPRAKRAILIRLNTSRRRLLVADSGPGIDASIRPYLFKPGYSLRVPPSGLGLYIASHYLAGMGASIHEASLYEQAEEFTGAHFIIDLSRTPNSKETAK